MDGRYVVGVDGSLPSRAAVRWAANRALSDGRVIALVHVGEPDGGMMGGEYAQSEARAGAHLLSETAAAIQTGDAGVIVTESLVDGPVAWALADFVTAHDILVAGTHKTGFLHGRVLGSRSVQIAAAVPCTVAIIPDLDLRFRRGVVAGVDRVATAHSIVRVAAGEAEVRGEELLLVQADVPVDAARDELAMNAALAAVQSDFPHLVVRSKISARPAAEALLDAARGKALLVLGPGSDEPTRSLIGSVIHDVLLNVNAPVVIARPAEDRQLVGPVSDDAEAS
ncbi:MAG: universal stress protein [Pseudolysinimonas sp.]